MACIKFFISQYGRKREQFGSIQCHSIKDGELQLSNLQWDLHKYGTTSTIFQYSYLNINAELYDEGNTYVSKIDVYMSKDDFYTHFSKYFNTEEKKEAKKRIWLAKLPLRIWKCVGIVLTAAILWGIFTFIQKTKEYHNKNVEEVKAGWDTNMSHFDGDAAMLNLSEDITTDNGVVKKWSNHDGDTAACRKDFLKMMNAIYSEDRYKRNPERIKAEIRGNNLRLYSMSFKDEPSALVAENTFYEYITDCDFDTVWVYEHQCGGSHRYRIYTRGDVKWDIDNSPIEGMPEKPHLTLWDYFTLRGIKKIREYQKKTTKAYDRHEAKVKAYREQYRKDFIQKKEQLYKRVRNKSNESQNNKLK